jgi:hypothetical protein
LCSAQAIEVVVGEVEILGPVIVIVDIHDPAVVGRAFIVVVFEIQ